MITKMSGESPVTRATSLPSTSTSSAVTTSSMGTSSHTSITTAQNINSTANENFQTNTASQQGFHIQDAIFSDTVRTALSQVCPSACAQNFQSITTVAQSALTINTQQLFTSAASQPLPTAVTSQIPVTAPISSLVTNATELLVTATALMPVTDYTLQQPSTSNTPLEPIFTARNRFKWRLDEVCHRELCSNMRQVLQWGMSKPLDTPWNEFYTKEDWKKVKFNKTQKETMNSDPRGDSFDVTLLYAVIQIVCHGLGNPNAPPDENKWTMTGENLENYIYRIKNIRNDLMHVATNFDISAFMEKIEEMRDLLTKMIKAAGVLYNIDPHVVQNIIEQMNTNINLIRDEPLIPRDIESYEYELLFHSLQEQLKTSGRDELKEMYIRTRTMLVSPVTFIAGTDIHIDVGSVFITLKLTDSSRDGNEKDIGVKDILNVTSQQQESGKVGDDIILVEGAAGAGKTTLTKLLVSDWCFGKAVINGLAMYDLVILMECRNSSLSSFYELLGFLLPETIQKFQKEDVLPSFKQLQTLLIIDGFDEMNKSSMNLFQELINIKKNANIHMITFSRPEKVKDFYSLVQRDYRVTHIKVGEIPHKLRAKFVEVYHEELRKQGSSLQQTSGLLNYLRRKGSNLHHLWGLPLYLVMLTVLWAIAPDKVNNITTATELYMEILGLTIHKLVERLRINEKTSLLSKTELERKIKVFLFSLSKVALKSLKDDNIVLANESSDELRHVCEDLNVPQNEVLGAFLVLKNSWTSADLSTAVSFPHKGQLDHCASLYICHILLGGCSNKNDDLNRRLQETLRIHGSVDPDILKQRIIEAMSEDIELLLPSPHTAATSATAAVSNPSILEVFKELYKGKPEDLSLTKFQNTLTHLLGLMHIAKQNISTETLEEMIKLLHQSGINGTKQWVAILSNVTCDETVVKYIAQITDLLGDENIMIDDSQVYGAWTLFKHVQPSSVRINIESDPASVPHLKELLLLLAKQGCKIKLDINDNSVKFYLDVMKQFHPDSVNIRIDSELKDVPQLEELMKLMVNTQVENLILNGVWRRRESVSSSFTDATAQILLRCGVKSFVGCASWIPRNVKLPTLKKIYLAVLNQNDAVSLSDLCSTNVITVSGTTSGNTTPTTTADGIYTKHATNANGLPSTTLRLPGLEYLGVDVVVGVAPELLSTLPHLPGAWRPALYLSDVTDAEVGWASKIIATMAPVESRDYPSIKFPSSSLTPLGVKDLVVQLQKEEVRVRAWLQISSPNITQQEVRELDIFTLETLNCSFFLCSDEEIWS